ncbi:MAG: quinate 5-dehydrogenase [Anaerolinea sp.]|nr:quinate 5-dehydrogenase [Anaerolinea sp.]
MKRAVSISIGSSKRDKAVEIDLLGEKISLERIGTDGDMEKAAQMYRELDGKVDAFGVGGANLGIFVDRKWYPLYSVASLTRFVTKTPVLDGTGLKTTLEAKARPTLEKALGDKISNRSVFHVTGVDRWGMLESFLDQKYENIYGDMMFTLGIPMALHTPMGLKRMAAILMPIAGRIPFRWVYPIGEAQEKRTPKWTKYFDWAGIVAGDCHYITRYMPYRMDGKIIVTNTTTTEDMKLFKDAGVKYVMTTTPVLDGRSFGTNMMEAAIAAATGRTDPVDYANPGNYFEDLAKVVDRIGLIPQLQEIN